MANKPSTKTKFNFALDNDLRKWLEEQADSFGISVGAMINICVSQYRDYMSFAKQFPDLMRMVKEEEDKKGTK